MSNERKLYEIFCYFTDEEVGEDALHTGVFAYTDNAENLEYLLNNDIYKTPYLCFNSLYSKFSYYIKKKKIKFGLEELDSEVYIPTSEVEKTENNTKIYDSYEDFLKREDKKLNGVCKTFAEKYPEFKGMNTTNEGSWNCVECIHIIDCVNCYKCIYSEGIKGAMYDKFSTQRDTEDYEYQSDNIEYFNPLK